jgi:hypothetical protein
MCKYGDTKTVLVTVPNNLSHTGQSFRKMAQIDSCIAPIVEALEAKGVFMRSSCCGHGKREGVIELQDGRMLLITQQTKSKGVE